MTAPPQVPISVRFWSRAGRFNPRNKSECSIWEGSIVGGYGQLTDGHGGKHYAHRVAYELTYGPIPEGMIVRHRCPGGPIRSCVRPCHLEVGTHADNARDRVIDGPQVTTTPVDDLMAAGIRYLFASGQFSQGDLAELILGDRTAQPQVAKLVSGKTYPSAPGPITRRGRGRPPKKRGRREPS